MDKEGAFRSETFVLNLVEFDTYGDILPALLPGLFYLRHMPVLFISRDRSHPVLRESVVTTIRHGRGMQIERVTFTGGGQLRLQGMFCSGRSSEVGSQLRGLGVGVTFIRVSALLMLCEGY